MLFLSQQPSPVLLTQNRDISSLIRSPLALFFSFSPALSLSLEFSASLSYVLRLSEPNSLSPAPLCKNRTLSPLFLTSLFLRKLSLCPWSFCLLLPEIFFHLELPEGELLPSFPLSLALYYVFEKTLLSPCSGSDLSF